MYIWGSRYHCCSTAFMGPLLERSVFPSSHELGFGHKTSSDWWVVGGRKEVYLFKTKHLTASLRNAIPLLPYGCYLGSTCCCASDGGSRQQRLFCQHMENYVLKGSLKLQWILREEVIFCVKSLCLGAVHCSITLTILTNTVIKTTAWHGRRTFIDGFKSVAVKSVALEPDCLCSHI